MKNVSHLSIPGSWWMGIPPEQKSDIFVCKITDIEYKETKHSSDYTFIIECDGDDEKYKMVWSDVERFWSSLTPLFKFQGILLLFTCHTRFLTLMHDPFNPRKRGGYTAFSRQPCYETETERSNNGNLCCTAFARLYYNIHICIVPF